VIPSWYLSLREDVTVGAGAELILGHPEARIPLHGLSPALVEALHGLAHPGEAEGRLAASILRAEGSSALARWYARLQQLARWRLLVVSVRAVGGPLATLVPIAPSFSFTFVRPLPDRSYILSRFVYARPGAGGLLLESPQSFARIILHDPQAAALFHALSRPLGEDELARCLPGLSTDNVTGILGLLLEAGMVREVSEDGTTAEDRDPVLQTWEFHDLLFHARSREGRHDAPVGATYSHLGRLPPPAVLKSPPDRSPTGVTIDLFRPDLEQLARQDAPFAAVQERRRSIREYAAEPITDQQLGEFLYRVARVKECRELEVPTPGGPVRMEFASRPYPGGGGLHELELYPVVNACRNIASGLYYYDPLHHRLLGLAGRTAEVEQLLREAGLATGIAAENTQVLLILAARFQRLAWKYSSLAYSLILKHVGVLYQTMYLAATAMNLAPCAIGVGDSDVFSRAAGTSYYAETSVGEFLLGSRR
jgi:SagB-type dehydrogenase family enzyme